jgi:SHS2 domain-containing protein
MPWREFGTTADTGIEIQEPSLATLLQTAAVAFTELTTELTSLEYNHTRKISVDSLDSETLLVDWLNEFLYLFEIEAILPIGFGNLIISFTPGGSPQVDAMVYFAKWTSDNPSCTEIKAVTYHMLKLERTTDGWYGRVVFDI